MSGCTDWYLVTTYYYLDGSKEETWEYVGTTCEDCIDSSYQSICESEDGAGGGGGGTEYQNQTVFEGYDQIQTVSTEAAYSPDDEEISGPTDNQLDVPMVSTNWFAGAKYKYYTIGTSSLGDLLSYVYEVEPEQPYPAPSLVEFNNPTYGTQWCNFSCGSDWLANPMRMSLSTFLINFKWTEIRVYSLPNGWRSNPLSFPNKTGMLMISK